MKYRQWVKMVDAACQSSYGISVHKLSYQPLMEWFDNGMDPEEAAEMAIQSTDY